MSQIFELTDKQKELGRMLGGPEKFFMAYGGSRSGKTFYLCRAIMIRASKVKSRHLIVREHFNHVKTSIWYDTFPKVKKLSFPTLTMDENKTDHFWTYPNGSEIWIAGLDDEKRVEKILGKEYSTIYFNECSQIKYKSVQIAITRLAEKNELKKKAYFDENPPTKKHWSYSLFIQGVDPESGEPVNRDDYSSIIMNPQDNIKNIDEDYLKLLAGLPEKQRQRFLLGQFIDSDDGIAYYAFDRDKHVAPTTLIHGTRFAGMDFNVNPMTAVICQVIGDELHVHDEVWLENSDTYKMSDYLIKESHGGASIIPDSTGKNRKTSGKSDHLILKENGFTVITTHNPFVRDRVNNLNRLFTAGRIKINPKCKKLIGDLNKVSWKDDDLDKTSDPMLTHVSDCLGYVAWKLFPMKKDFEFNNIPQDRR